MKKRLILPVAAILVTVLILLTSCGADNSNAQQDTTTADDTETEAPETTPTPSVTYTPETTPTPSVTYAPEEYTYTESLNSVNDIRRGGIKIGDVIVEGYEEIGGGDLCTGIDSATGKWIWTIPSMSLMDEAQLAECGELAVVKYSPNIEFFCTLDNAQSADTVRFNYCPLNGGNQVPPEAGVYIMSCLVGVETPMEADIKNEVSSIEIVEGKFYPSYYRYSFIVVVETE